MDLGLGRICTVLYCSGPKFELLTVWVGDCCVFVYLCACVYARDKIWGIGDLGKL